MSSPHSDSYDSHARKRVGKACDRCRLKKSKCDGASPCSRCKVDNAICVFGERKKAHDRIIPKGYVEMLEAQQNQTVAGLRALYSMLLDLGQWPGAALKEHDGHPLTHDILERLGVLNARSDSLSPMQSPKFEDDLEKLHDRMTTENGLSNPRQRKGSPPSDEEPELAHSDSTPEVSPSLRTSSISISATSYSRKRSPSTPPPDEFPHLVPSAKQFKFDTTPVSLRKHQNVLDAQIMGLQVPYTMESPDLDLQNMNLSFQDDSNNVMYDPLYSTAYLTPAISSLPVNNAAFGMNFDADFDMFSHSGLHNGSVYQ